MILRHCCSFFTFQLHSSPCKTILSFNGWPEMFGASLVAQLVKIRLKYRRPGFDLWVGKIPWRREMLPTPVFWPGESHGLFSPWVAMSQTRLNGFHFHFSRIPLHDFFPLKFTRVSETTRCGVPAQGHTCRAQN